MSAEDQKATLLNYLQGARGAMLWKLEGLSEYDVRRPLTPTGTNLLGLVKHLCWVDAAYFGVTFGRPHPDPRLRWDAQEGFNTDMYATADESPAQITELYQQVWAHSDATIEALPLDAAGEVPWWDDNGETTLHSVLVHMGAETTRHAGHADILRETIDGAVGSRAANPTMSDGDAEQWARHHERLAEIARQAAS